ncbi:hypothetical protein [Falsibacillus albus]|uniref:Uncharacterized protein n=1 Tax=Falsibacillus albus TaxID=2478915 RepID=A0A3L7K481_9BACI|nr:hypothetical protein [Falsibacillus albus]RLQ97455.1 hypothetical protein D9X91_04700 [Falsibacillus albus]
MNSFIHKAVMNNIAWCGSVCEAHGLTHHSKENVWGLFSKAPVYYPEIISSNLDADLKDIEYFIEKGEVSSVKDSYANLDLSTMGFKILFEADWIFHTAYSGKSDVLHWREVRSADEMVEWIRLSSLENVIMPTLLNHSDVKFFISEFSGEGAGFIANMNDGVVGISNVFSTGDVHDDLWKDIPLVAGNAFPGESLVGYEQGSDLTAALKAGWTSIGPLRVWVK